MGLFLRHEADDARWAVWKMEESLEDLPALLPDARRVSCERDTRRFTSERRKMEWLSVRALLYSMLPEDKEIMYSPRGKPYLKDHSSFISISHTKGYVAVILSPVAPVGIDIERYGPRAARARDRFMRPDERAEPYQGDVTWSALLHWSAKETIFKLMENADADLRKLRLSHFIPQREGEFRVREYATGRGEVFTVGYRIHPDFVLTWAITGS